MDSAVSDSVSHKVDITSRTIASVLTNLAAVDVTFQVEEANISALPISLLRLPCPCISVSHHLVHSRALFRSTEALKSFVGDPILSK